MAKMDKKKTELKELINDFDSRDNYGLENKDIEIVFMPTRQENTDILVKFCQREITAQNIQIWALILDQISEDYLNDDILGFLLDNNIHLVALSHLSLSSEWLLKIFEKDNSCVEALETVSLRLLDCEGNTEYTAFIDKYKNIQLYEFLLKHIIHINISSYDRIKKYKHLLNNIFMVFDSGSAIVELAKKIEKYLHIIQCSNESELHNALNSYDYWQLIALSKNENCSTDILNELVTIKGLKFSKLIKRNALYTLSQQNKR